MTGPHPAHPVLGRVGAMEPAEDRPDDERQAVALTARHDVVQWSRPRIGRMTSRGSPGRK